MMTRDQVIDLLTVAITFDQRTLGDSDVIAWAAALDDIDFATARDAVIAHYKEETRRVMPADIRRYRFRPGERPQPLPFKDLCRRCCQPGHTAGECEL